VPVAPKISPAHRTRVNSPTEKRKSSGDRELLTYSDQTRKYSPHGPLFVSSISKTSPSPETTPLALPPEVPSPEHACRAAPVAPNIGPADRAGARAPTGKTKSLVLIANSSQVTIQLGIDILTILLLAPTAPVLFLAPTAPKALQVCLLRHLRRAAHLRCKRSSNSTTS